MTTAKEKVREKIELLEALKWWMDNAEHEPINSDTLHFCMEDWTLRRQWEYAEARAREDCELNLKAIFNQNVANLRKELRKCLSKLGNSSKLAQN